MWRNKWWEQNSLVDKLVNLGHNHPLVKHLEAEGWEGLSEDLRTRERFASWPKGYRMGVRCRACDGIGEVTIRWGGEWRDIPCNECEGTGIRPTIPDDELYAPFIPNGWGWLYRAKREELGRERAKWEAYHILAGWGEEDWDI